MNGKDEYVRQEIRRLKRMIDTNKLSVQLAYDFLRKFDMALGEQASNSQDGARFIRKVFEDSTQDELFAIVVATSTVVNQAALMSNTAIAEYMMKLRGGNLA